jgi:hypothetical protein
MIGYAMLGIALCVQIIWSLDIRILFYVFYVEFIKVFIHLFY